MAYRYLSPALAPGAVPTQVVSAGSGWPSSLASDTAVPPLILTATASTNGAQTRNVVLPSRCGVAPSGSAALAHSVERSKTEMIRDGGRDFGRTLAGSFSECN